MHYWSRRGIFSSDSPKGALFADHHLPSLPSVILPYYPPLILLLPSLTPPPLLPSLILPPSQPSLTLPYSPPLPLQASTLTGLSALASLGGYTKWKSTPTPTPGPHTTAGVPGLTPISAPGPGLTSGPGQSLPPTTTTHYRDKDSLASIIQEDTARLNSVAMFFLKKSFKHVSILDGGFVSAVRYLRQSNPSLSLSSVLVDAQIPLLEAVLGFNPQSDQAHLRKPVNMTLSSNILGNGPPVLSFNMYPFVFHIQNNIFPPSR